MEHSFLFIEIYRGKLDWDFKHFERKKPNELTGITRVLETFTDISKKFESSQFPTIHFIIPYKNKLKKAWQPDLSDSDLFSNIKSNLLQQITQTILSCVTKFRKIALLLFLPKNKFLQFSTAEKKFIEFEDFEMKNKENIPVHDDTFYDFIEKRNDINSSNQFD